MRRTAARPGRAPWLVLLLWGLLVSSGVAACGRTVAAPQGNPPPASTPTSLPVTPGTEPQEPEVARVLEQLDHPVVGTVPDPAPAITASLHLTTASVLSPTVELTTTEALTEAGVLTATTTLTGASVLTVTGELTEAAALSQPLALGEAGPISPLPTPSTRPLLLPTPTARPTPVAVPQGEPTPDGTPRTVRVPILMYHYVSVPPADANFYRQDLSVAPELFAAHLDALQAAGYSTISLYTLYDHLMRGAPLPPNPVAITFDDGYRDNFDNALPRLRERQMTATFFVVTDFMDEERPEYLTWEMARAMLDAGMSIESHGRNHVSLANKDADYLVWQALGSRETIAFELNVQPRFVSYPAGEFDELTKEIFRSAGYWAGFTTVQGATHSSDDNLFELKRVRVRGTTTPEELLRLVRLDW